MVGETLLREGIPKINGTDTVERPCQGLIVREAGVTKDWNPLPQ
jgi:hypothetical protein